MRSESHGGAKGAAWAASAADKRRPTIVTGSIVGGAARTLGCCGSVCAGAVFGRQRMAAGPPGIKRKETDLCGPVDLQGRLGCGALCLLALGRKQGVPSPDSPSRTPCHLVEPSIRSSKRSMQISDATDLNRAHRQQALEVPADLLWCLNAVA
jgi:hypothetical protein